MTRRVGSRTRTADVLLELNHDAKQMPPELRPFCRRVVHLLGTVVGQVSYVELVQRLKDNPQFHRPVRRKTDR